LTPDTVEKHKHYDCRSYGACLDEAVRENWHQFHCRACRAYEALAADDPSNLVLTRLARALARR
jgi:hypothetical protein